MVEGRYPSFLTISRFIRSNSEWSLRIWITPVNSNGNPWPELWAVSCRITSRFSGWSIVQHLPVISSVLTTWARLKTPGSPVCKMSRVPYTTFVLLPARPVPELQMNRLPYPNHPIKLPRDCLNHNAHHSSETGLILTGWASDPTSGNLLLTSLLWTFAGWHTLSRISSLEQENTSTARFPDSVFIGSS